MTIQEIIRKRAEENLKSDIKVFFRQITSHVFFSAFSQVEIAKEVSTGQLKPNIYNCMDEYNIAKCHFGKLIFDQFINQYETAETEKFMEKVENSKK